MTDSPVDKVTRRFSPKLLLDKVHRIALMSVQPMPLDFEVKKYSFQKSCPCPFSTLTMICEDIAAFLAKDELNIAAIACKVRTVVGFFEVLAHVVSVHYSFCAWRCYPNILLRRSEWQRPSGTCRMCLLSSLRIFG